MTSITRYKLRKLVKYALVTVTVAMVLTLFSGDPVPRYLWAWSLLGLWTGVLEEFLFGRRFRSLAIPLQFVGKIFAVNLLTSALLALAFAFDGGSELHLGPEVPTSIGHMFITSQFFRLALRVAVVTSVAILVVQIEELMGRRMFLGFLLGRYERPKSEERVMLAIDLVGSTALAERLGDLHYFRFLNVTHSLLTDAVLRNEAEIYKYIGDEVIFSWPMRKGIRHLNCLDLYFDIVERIAVHENDLLREFGAVPRYRGAVHGGRVISAQIGHIKRAIEFSGDVMNTLSRMLGLSKQLDAGILVSADLLQRMPSAQERFRIGPLTVMPVKGRRREVSVHTVERTIGP
ncbi:MAG: adenylate/guanylate cyclase domain-containing protein [Flavobacteriales bacterium]|nr:adenylate/guanylate cyclase domain-containing protein [Flavobacteriales bacterium]MCB9193919.1 adenylate/guanylate cyclase domain-containing protein [Flavobacteriales bacterium]